MSQYWRWGDAINAARDNPTLKVEGEENIDVYHACIHNPEDPQLWQSEGEHCFYWHCGSCLGVYDAHYPDLIHPFASAIDTPLPQPPERTYIMHDFAASWVEVPNGLNKHHHKRYPEESLASWHQRLSLPDKA